MSTSPQEQLADPPRDEVTEQRQRHARLSQIPSQRVPAGHLSGPEREQELDALVARADAALYRSRERTLAG